MADDSQLLESAAPSGAVAIYLTRPSERQAADDQLAKEDGHD
jgi:hypothetical protein